MTAVDIDLQVASKAADLPTRAQLRTWARAAAEQHSAKHAGLLVRIVDEPESRTLNRDFRGRDKPTNILSFPFEPPPGLPAGEWGDHLGDLVICAPVVQREAVEQHKRPEAHWAHILVHGVLHLLGYDHQNDADAVVMETRERDILHRLGYPDPYANDRES